VFPGIMQRKNWPHTKGGAENSHGSDGYEENIYASTHSPLRQQALVYKQNICQSIASTYVTVI